MDIDNHNNNNNINSISFQTTRTSHDSRSTTRTVQVHGTHHQEGKWIVEEQHVGDFLAVEQEQKSNVYDQRRQMHPSNRHVCNLIRIFFITMCKTQFTKRHSSQRRRSTEQQQQRQQIVMENRRQCLQRREGRQQWQLELQHIQVQVASRNELDRQRYTNEEFLDEDLNEKLHQLQVYEEDQIDPKEQWEQAQLKLFEELEQLELQALAANYIEHLKYMKLLDDKDKQKRP
jgi:hypothetical protein